MNQAQSITTLRVRYADTDAMRVAYYANYFVWFEVGRTEPARLLKARVLYTIAGGKVVYERR